MIDAIAKEEDLAMHGARAAKRRLAVISHLTHSTYENRSFFSRRGAADDESIPLDMAEGTEETHPLEHGKTLRFIGNVTLLFCGTY